MNRIDDSFGSRHNRAAEHQIELALNDKQRFGRISVQSFYGIVELSGVVRTSTDKALALQLAQRVEGVTTVLESIRIEERRAVIHRRARHRRYRVALQPSENPNLPPCHFAAPSARGRSLTEVEFNTFSPFRR